MSLAPSGKGQVLYVRPYHQVTDTHWLEQATILNNEVRVEKISKPKGTMAGAKRGKDLKPCLDCLTARLAFGKACALRSAAAADARTTRQQRKENKQSRMDNRAKCGLRPD
ncbi:hypothetical protein O181_018939 [Austropuccinia psidii MF-1]|uniref:Uncharacterized protein n=1 Tax=Austropuccinia psidii MF-1 TaxID=1389203 RepID=A0A9Q3C8L0_9BASI|nr:hypothetical protein [Austropuccinia psidii MF-1]